MPKTRTPKFYRTLTFGALVAAAGLAAVMGACSSGSNPNALSGGPGSGQDSSLPPECSAGKQGCPCSTPGETVSCGRLEQDFGSYVTCQAGNATCINGGWGPCVGNTHYQKSKRGVSIEPSDGHTPRIRHTSQTCADPCDPNTCVQTTDGPGDVPDGAPVLITDAGVTIPPTTTTGGGGSGDGGACSGLQCQVNWGCGSSSQTTITGTVYDPAMQNPLYNAYVYIPVDPNPANLPAFSSGASCDSCAGVTLNAVAVTQTDVHGNFTLTNVPATNYGPGQPIPLVVQMGKWRRVQLLTSVPSCTSTAIPNANSRLPQSMFDGWNNHADIPRMALASGSADPFECMMLKMGISPAEFQLPGSGTRRIDFYQANGQQFQGGNAPAYSNLVGSQADLMPYDIVLLPCEGTQDNGNENYSDNVVKYANAGGRMFTTHYGYTWLSTPNGFNNGGHATNPVTGVANPFYKVATWDYDYENDNATGQIDTNFPKGATFETWMDGLPAPNAGSVTTGNFGIYSPRHDLDSVNATYATEWVHDSDWETPKPLSFTFNTPVGPVDAGADSGVGACGRVVYSDFHVSTSDIISGNSCTSSADCGYGSTCSGGSTGTCTPVTCVTNADCPDTSYTCTGGAAGTCQQPASQCSWSGNCWGGSCNGSHKCTCANSGQCGGAPCTGGVCASSNSSCTNNNQCPGDQTCVGLTSGTCTHTCSVNSDCTGGELCEAGQCTGCSTRHNCPSNQCNGASSGTCSGNSGEFPNSCSQGPMDVQESALEFMLLDLSACVSPDNAPPPPPPTPVTVYNPVTFAVQFTSSCPSGTHVRWTELDWQATIPSTASIVFNGQTAATTNFSSAQTVQIADATATTPGLPTGWNAALIDVSPVDAGVAGAFNTASPAVQSNTDFQLTITLNPTTDKSQAPTLIQWQVKSDCPPSE